MNDRMRSSAAGEAGKAPAPSEARVFLIGGRTLCNEGLAAILNNSPATVVVGRSLDISDACSRIPALSPDVVVIDVAGCGSTPPASFDAIRQLSGHHVVALVRGDTSDVMDALEAGALGCITVDSVDVASIISTVVSASRGEAALAPRLSSAVLARMQHLSRRAASATGRDVPRTQRESEVLQLLVQGLSNRQIAQRLSVSESTIKNHLHSIYSKLGVESRSQAVSEAMRQGLV